MLKMVVFVVAVTMSFSAFGQRVDIVLNNALTYVDSPAPVFTPAQGKVPEQFGVSSEAPAIRGRRRAVRVPTNPDANKVGFFVADLVARNQEGVPVRGIIGETTRPLQGGVGYRLSFRRPGEDSWTVFSTSTVDPAEVGMYRIFYLHVGNEFFDLIDGIKRFWNAGVAGYKIEEIRSDGSVTSASQEVTVGTEPIGAFGPLQNVVVDNDKRQILLVGVFPTPPVTVLMQKVSSEVGDLFRVLVVSSDDNYVVNIPDDVSGEVAVVVGTKYPHAEFSTQEVSIPPAPTPRVTVLRESQ